KQYKDIYKRENGKLSVSVINKDLSDRMASTIRHNRARGSADVDLISNIIAELVEIGKTDSWISKLFFEFFHSQNLSFSLYPINSDEIVRIISLFILIAFYILVFFKSTNPIQT
ncbi:MAG: hypothetical protein LBD98_01520, partial [Endomicrobium sp.]|nr:hypothetical protein [Endomicrobium sp.]